MLVRPLQRRDKSPDPRQPPGRLLRRAPIRRLALVADLADLFTQPENSECAGRLPLQFEPCSDARHGPETMRSLLFVPADSEKKLDKAMGAGADAVIIDLEDSIAPERKNAARNSAADYLRGAIRRPNRPRLIVRVNGFATGLTDADLDAVVPAAPDAILLPKAEGGAAIAHADAKLAAREAIAGLPDGSIEILALATETAAALFLAGTYRGSSTRLSGLTWGAEDLSAELGAEANRDADGNFLDPYRLARALCLAGAAVAEVSAIDTVYVDFRNEAGLKRECEEAHRDGFTGKLAIHPAQVPVINAAFTPTPEQIEKAKAVVAAFAAQPGAGTVGIGGVMYDRPHLARANRLLAQVKN
jgi:citrate lyase subunit beta/citryl-CoA lyase